MTEKQLGAAPGEQGSPEAGTKPGWYGRLRTQPGFRTAVVAFVLTVVLGIGGTAAYAYWSQSTSTAITGTTRPEQPPVPPPSTLPANTAGLTAKPALAARPGTPSGPACAALLSDEEMRSQDFADVRFSWAGAASATSYVITVKGTNGFSYDQTQTVKTKTADFRFGRLKSDQYGKPVGTSSPFYTKYTVRVMPMAGTVPGDPLYFTYEYEHYNSSNCYWSEPTGNAPVGSAAPLVCAAPVTVRGAGGYSDLPVSWARSSGATSYSVTMVNADRSYGGELSVTGTQAAFRVMRPLPENDAAPYFARYTVRVQPMIGAAAGDPLYLTYQWGKNSHECW
ncbi:hypothetical protein ACFFON_16050 [Arthrobacter citreus]|uniref:hypothetical protein n=1 Tax=Arthrobacter TaxID=1663 RepID=UPI0012640F54|nr:hypothetical protein [Arthrobacter gandavensis]